MLDIHPAMGADINAIDLLHETIRCYGPMLQDAEKEALQKKLLDILDDRRTGIVGKKKAVASVSILAVYLTDSLLANFISSLTESFGAEDIPHAQRRLLISLSGSVARSIPRRFGAYLEKLAPFILCAIGKEEYDVAMDFYDEDEGVTSADDEVREAAFIALEDFLASCSEDMRPFTDEVIESSLRYLRYDPSLAQQEDEEEIGGDDNGDEDDGEHGDLEEDDDFEQEVGMSDGDDASWKIRRCAAKVLHTIIDTQGTGDLLENGTLFDKVAPVLIKCFKEREDHVRLEVIAALSALVKITGNSTPGLDAPTFIDDDIYGSPAFVIKSRKRRRGGSDASMFDTHSPVKGTMSPVEPFSPTSGARADLARLSPQIIRATVNLLKHSSIPTKQAAVILLKDFVHMQNGGLNENMAQVIEPTMEIIKTPTVLAGASAVISISGAGSATGNSLRIEALQLLGTVCDTHSSRFIAPYMPTVTPALIQAVNDKYFKISAEAIIVAESVVNVLTPPRSAGRDAQFKSDLGKIFDIIVDKARANDTDLEVRQRALHALGTGLSRTCGENRLISSSKRSHALGILQDRLRNETTRLASVQAIDIVALSSFDQDGLKNDWVQIVTLELANQLRKADRTLRGSSLAALKHLIANTTVLEQLDDETVKKLVDLLMPLVDAKNLVLLGMALDVLSELAKRSPITVVNEDLNSSLCRIVATPLAGHILEAFLAFVATIGLQNVGQPLMHALLQRVGVTGDPAIVGAAIGTLLVSGGSSVGVGIDDIIKELQTAQDDDRKCLALSILGEAGLKLGAASPMQPAIFLDYFKSKSDKVPRAAAMALGRAGAGNIPLYLPIIMSNLTKSGNTQFLLLHSIKEILLHASIARTSIASSTDEIWSMLLGVSELEDNKAIGAECIGRLISIEPKKYLPVLQQYLQGSDPSIRGMVIQAIRFALSDSDETFTDVLKPMLIPLLKTMLNDSVLENRRLALTSLNSATSNKAALILPYISSLLPLVIRESVVNPDLVREVQMGPFKIKVDDGLENRKVSFLNLFIPCLLIPSYRALTRLYMF
jgi:cullin-associated NEDD8-dissociated protein 1